MTPVDLPAGIDPRKIRIIMLCEALPEDPADYFYTSRDSLYVTNTVAAFNQAGIAVESIEDIVKLGVYLTAAVKAPREGLVVPAAVIKAHSAALEAELDLFPNVRAILLMGDAAIKALNVIAKRTTGARVIPAGSTYKIRAGTFCYQDIRVFPSYLQTGRNFLIEKAKQRMVAEDIRSAFALL